MRKKSLFAAYFAWFVIRVYLTTVAPILLAGFENPIILGLFRLNRGLADLVENPVILLVDFLSAIPLYPLYLSAFGAKEPGKPNMLKKAFFVWWSLNVLVPWLRILHGSSPLTDRGIDVFGIAGLLLFTLMLNPLYEWAFKGGQISSLEHRRHDIAQGRLSRWRKESGKSKPDQHR